MPAVSARDPDRRRIVAGLLASAGAALTWRIGRAVGSPAGSTAVTGGAPATTAAAAETVSSPAVSRPAGADTTGAPTTAPSTTTTTAAPSSTAPSTTTTHATTTTGAPAPTATTAGTPAAASGAVTVICREAWGARPPAGEFVEHTIARLTVHHTAVILDRTSQAPSRARGHQRYHQDKGWPDLAYHFLVDDAGHVYEGRPWSARGDTATEYDPTGHFLVCAEGDYDRQQVAPAMLASIAGLLAWASLAFGVDPATIAGHRAYAATTCPGRSIDAVIADGTLEEMVRDRIAAGATGPAVLCGAEGAALVAAIEAGTA